MRTKALLLSIFSAALGATLVALVILALGHFAAQAAVPPASGPAQPLVCTTVIDSDVSVPTTWTVAGAQTATTTVLVGEPLPPEAKVYLPQLVR